MKNIKIKYKILLSMLFTLVILGLTTNIVGIEKDTTVRTVNANVKISTTVVKNMVFKNANVDKSNTRITKLVLTKHKKTFLYDIIFFAKNKKYNYVVNANNGKIIKKLQEDKKEMDLNSKAKSIFDIFSFRKSGLFAQAQDKIRVKDKISNITQPAPILTTPNIEIPEMDNATRHWGNLDNKVTNTENDIITENTRIKQDINKVEEDKLNNELTKIKEYFDNKNYEKGYNHFFEKYTYFVEKMKKEDLEYTVNVLKQLNEDIVKTENKEIYDKNIINFKNLDIF